MDVPAYPQAGLQEMSGKASEKGTLVHWSCLRECMNHRNPHEDGITKIGVKKDLPEENKEI